MATSERNSQLVTIEYAADTRRALEALYRSKAKGDITAEALDVYREAVEAVPTSYTAWQLYDTTLRALGGRDAKGEALVERILTETPKNYQLWNYRRQVFLNGESTTHRELAYAEIAIQDDPKNIHAWAHRQAVLGSLQDATLWEAELKLIHEMLESDAFNNSAWTQLTYVLKQLSTETREAELTRALIRLKAAPHCVAGWNFLRHELRESSIERVKEAVLFCHGVLKGVPGCVPCLEFLAEMYFSLGIGSTSDPPRRRFFDSAAKIWRQCQTVDPIRSPYWKARLSDLERRCI